MRTTSLILGLVTVLNASTALNAQEAVWKTQGVTKDEIVLGMHADLSGVAASFSVGVVNSIRMRIDVQQRQRRMVRMRRAQQRMGDGMVAAQADQRRAGGEDRAGLAFDARPGVLASVEV